MRRRRFNSPDAAYKQAERSLVELERIEADQKTVAERKWRAPLKPKAEQKACDAGLFSDDSKQTELF